MRPVSLKSAAALLLSPASLISNAALAGDIEVVGADSAAITAGLQRSQRGDTINLPSGPIELSEDDSDQVVSSEPVKIEH